MAKVTGVIEATNDNFGKYNIKVNGGWYSTKPEWVTLKPLPDVGATVSFDDGGGKYIKGIKLVASTTVADKEDTAMPTKKTYARGSFPIDPLDGQIAIIRQNALTNAISFAVLSMPSPPVAITTDDIIAIAKKFEQYTAGFADKRAADKLAEEMLKTEE